MTDHAARTMTDTPDVAGHLLTIEIFLGDVESFQLADDSTPYVEDAAKALDAVRAAITALQSRIAELEAELHRIKTAANKSVDNHAEEFGGVHRAWKRAEAERDAVLARLEKLEGDGPPVEQLIEHLNDQIHGLLKELDEARKDAAYTLQLLRDAVGTIARKNEALRPFATEANRYDPDKLDDIYPLWAQGHLKIGDLRRARAALSPKEGAPSPVLDALLWAWTNLTGRLPDTNTMTETEIEKYWEDYRSIVSTAVVSLTGLDPDNYRQKRALSPKEGAGDPADDFSRCPFCGARDCECKPPEPKEGGDAGAALDTQHTTPPQPVEPPAGAESSWPAAISDGLTLACADCGLVPRFDYRVKEEFWRQHVPGPERLGVICLSCLDSRCGGVGLVDALIEIQWTGTGHTVVLEPMFRHLYEPRPRYTTSPTPSEPTEAEVEADDARAMFAEYALDLDRLIDALLNEDKTESRAAGLRSPREVELRQFLWDNKIRGLRSAQAAARARTR